MKRSTLVLIIVACSLVALGLIIAFVGACMAKFDFRAFGKRLEVNTYEIGESFESISVNSTVEDVILLPSADGKCVIECSEEKNVLHDASVIDGVLSVEKNDQRKWYDHISLFTVGKHYIKIYLPEREYKDLAIKVSTGDVKIHKSFTFENIDIKVSTGDVECSASANGAITVRTTTGDVELENLSAGAINVSVDTGDIELGTVVCSGNIDLAVRTGEAKLSDVKCETLNSTGTTGGISLSSVIASGKIDIERGTGDIKFDRSDAASLKIKTTTGDVYGSFASEKIFYTKTSTGKIRVPKSTSGGECDVQTSTGDIILSISR